MYGLILVILIYMICREIPESESMKKTKRLNGEYWQEDSQMYFDQMSWNEMMRDNYEKL